MYINQINKTTTYNTRLNINKQVFLHIIPDFNSTVPDVLKNLNISLNNCQGLCIKTGTMKFGTKSINPKLYFYTLKQREDLELNLLQTIPTKLLDNKFIIIDHTILSQGCQQFFELTGSEKQTNTILFNNLKSEFNSLKTKHPTVENVLLFNLSCLESPNLLDLISNFKLFGNNTEIFKVFDNWCLTSVSAAKEKTSFIPLMNYDNKGNIEILFSNVNKIRTALENVEPIQPEIIQTEPEAKDSTEEITKQVTDAITHKSAKTDDDLYKTTTEIDKKKLSTALKHFKVRDPIVANNIKTSVDLYLKQNPEQAQKEDLEHLVLKSIHYSLFNDENIKDEYIADPNRLISKLTEMNNHAVNLNYPEPIHQPQLVSPQDIIDIHKITGLDRHKYEFGENLDFNVHTLFKSLESRKQAPIKIIDVKSEIKDNNLDRVKEFTITVQNLTGDLKDPYELKLRLPALVNDRYFKLNGQSYILSNQQYLNPLTKDRYNEVRFLSHYNMVTLKSVNTKYNSSQIQDILTYIRLKYPQLIKNVEVDSENKINSAEFTNGSIISPNSHTPFKTPTKEITFIEGDYKLHDLTNDQYVDLHIPKNEYIFNELLTLIQSVNPQEKLNKSSKSIPYIQIHIMGTELPYIIFLWQQLGLIEALMRFGIDYEIGETPRDNKYPDVILPLDGKMKLFVYPENKRQELIVNGLTLLPKGSSFSSKDLGDRGSINDFIASKYGNKVILNLDLAMENIIDPTTKQLLDFEDLPTNFIDLSSGPMLDKLLNDQPDHPADLKNLRLRQSEVLTNLLYSEICMAYNKYVSDMRLGITSTKLYFHPDYLIANLLGKHAHSDDSGGSLMDYSVTFSPVDELVKASKTVKTGPGGVPSKRAFRKEHRAIHPSYLGNLASHSVSEYASVGIVNTLTLGTSISNNFGNFGGKRANLTKHNTDTLSIDEYLIPFNGFLDSERMVLAR